MTEGSSHTTTDHEQIKRWAEERGARPAVVEATEGADESGLLRFEFPDAPGGKSEELDEIDWEPFFRTFENRKLAFVYQDKTADGSVSRFGKFVRRES